MKLFKSEFFSLLLSILISCLLLYLYYGSFLSQPNSYVLTSSGDGLKNYFTYAYHIAHDSDYMQFDGMNYPYGEYIPYTDNQPLISNILKIFNLSSLGILHVFMFVSIPVAAIFNFLCLRKLKINLFYSVAFSIIITFLAPQLERIAGHFSLAYSFFIPMQVWAILRLNDNFKNKRNWVILLLLNFAWFFLHPYMGMMATLLTILFFVFRGVYLVFFERENWIIHLKRVFLTLAPILLFLACGLIFDSHANRNPNPNGLFLYTADISTVFLPPGGPVKRVIDSFLEEEYVNGNIEGYAYIGVASLFLLIPILFKLFIKRETIGVLHYLIPASVVILLISFCFPFKYGFEEYTFLLGPLKQFRGLGRFAWVFYYIVLFACAKFLFDWWNTSKTMVQKGVHIICSFLLFYLYAQDFNNLNVINERRILSKIQPNLFSEKNFSFEEKQLVKELKQAKYASILALPYFHYASEVVDVFPHEKSMQNAFMISLQTGLPLINSNTSRLSFTETKKALNILSPSWTHKEYKNDINLGDRILIVAESDLLSSREKAIISKAQFIGQMQDFNIYESTFGNLLHYQKPNEELNKNESHKIIEESVKDTRSPFLFGAIAAGTELVTEDFQLLYDIDTNELQVGVPYEISTWIKYDDFKFNDLQLIVEIIDVETGQAVWDQLRVLRFNCDHVGQRWARMSASVQTGSTKERVRVLLKGKDSMNPSYMIGSTVLQPADQKTLHRSFLNSSESMINNYFVGNVWF